jgi:hypothetical protein
VASHRPGLQIKPPDRLHGESSRITIHAVSSDLHVAPALFSATAGLARDLDAKVLLLFAEVVPYPVPLAEPPVQTAILETHLRAFAEQASVETTVHIYLCRDRNQTLRHLLPPESIVVMARPSHWWMKGWWSWADRNLTRKLRRDGHHVIVVDPAAVRGSNASDLFCNEVTNLKVKDHGNIHSIDTQRRD